MDVAHRQAELEDVEDVSGHYSRHSPASKKVENPRHMNNYGDFNLPQGLS